MHQTIEEEAPPTVQILTEAAGGCQEASMTEDSQECHLTPDVIQNSHPPSVYRDTPPSPMTVTSTKEEERQEWNWCPSGSNFSDYTNIQVRKYLGQTSKAL